MTQMFETEPAGLEIPEPSAEAIASSERLIRKIVERIEQRGGALRFDEYMQMALYEPDLGYYSNAVEIGSAGDFITAPQISVLFGDCLAIQLRALIEQSCTPVVLEVGAGMGHLCAQLLEKLPGLQRYYILDLSGGLKQRQYAFLQRRLNPELLHKVEWLERLPSIYSGIVLANELFDAMPVRLIEKQDRWCERGVGFDGSRFNWQYMKPDAPLATAVANLESCHGELPHGYRSEVNLNYGPWMKALADSTDQVIMLAIDYGYEQADYYHPQRNQGTLICHYRHRVHEDPLMYPGLQDITAFVDFDALADAAETAGFDLLGLVSQADFLLANGLLDSLERRSDGADEATRIALSQQVKTLTLPQEMGERFKVLALKKNASVDLKAMRRGAGFG